MKGFIKDIERLLTTTTGRQCTAFNIGKWYLYTNVPQKDTEKAKNIVMGSFPFKKCVQVKRQWQKDYVILMFSL